MKYEFYKIKLKSNPEYAYIGYTTNFNKRKYQHEMNLKNETKTDFPLYKTINGNGGWDNVHMGILECGNYDNLKDVYIRERELIDKHKPKLNGQLPSKININYSDNPKKYKSKWYHENKNKIDSKCKQIKEQKVRCDICNIELLKKSLSNHNKCKSHLKNILS